MADEFTGMMSESGLYSDYDRVAALLNECQRLSKENRNYNPIVIREFFTAIAELYFFLSSFAGETDLIRETGQRIEKINKVTRAVYVRLLTEKDFKVPFQIFHELDDIWFCLEKIKNEANLGIKKKTRVSVNQKFQNVFG